MSSAGEPLLSRLAGPGDWRGLADLIWRLRRQSDRCVRKPMAMGSGTLPSPCGRSRRCALCSASAD